MWTMTRAYLDNIQEIQAGGAGNDSLKLDGGVLVLFKAPVNPVIDLAWGDVSASECDYTNYGRQLLGALTGPTVMQGSKSCLVNGAHSFSTTTAAVSNNVYGQGLLGADSATLLGVEMFDAEIPLGEPDAGFLVAPIFGIGPNAAGYGNSIVSP